MTTDFEHDTPGVIAPPPLMAVAVIVLGLLLDWIAPAYILANVLSLTVRIVLGLALIAASGFLHFSSVGLFRRAGTNPEPWKPTLHLITGGIYRWLRNPIYVAGVLGIAGIAIIFASDWMMALDILFAFVLHFGVVRREERYLEAKFGDAYRLYKLSVPRYGWPFF